MAAIDKKQQSFLPPLWILTLLACWGLFWVASELKELVVLLVVGYCLAYIIEPILEYLERRGVRRPLGLLAILVVIIGGLTIMIFSIVPTFLQEFQRLAENFPHYVTVLKGKLFSLIDTVRIYLPPAIQSRFEESAKSQVLSGVNGETMGAVLGGVGAALLKGYSLTMALLNLILLPFIIYYLSMEFRSYHRFGLSFIPKKYQHTVYEIFSQIDEHVRAFIGGQILVGLILFALYAIGLGFIVKIDLWLLLAFISGFGNLIPYLGTFAGIVLSSLMAIVTYHDFSALWWVFGTFAVIQALEGTLITPKIVGERVGISPLTVILALFAFGKILGLLGLCLAIPFAAALRVTGRYLHKWVVQRV